MSSKYSQELVDRWFDEVEIETIIYHNKTEVRKDTWISADQIAEHFPRIEQHAFESWAAEVEAMEEAR